MAQKLLKGALVIASVLLVAQLANRRTRIGRTSAEPETDAEGGEE